MLAVGHWHGRDTHVWDATTNRLIKTIPSQEANVAFSPDGRLLAVAEPHRCSFYDVSTWKLLHQTARGSNGEVPRPVAFSPDGSMVVFITDNRLQASLLATRDFSELATIDVHRLMREFSFSPDSSLIIERSHPSTALNIWNLRRIRTSLGNLDWDLPAFVEPESNSTKPMRIRFLQKQDSPST